MSTLKKRRFIFLGVHELFYCLGFYFLYVFFFFSYFLFILIHKFITSIVISKIIFNVDMKKIKIYKKWKFHVGFKKWSCFPEFSNFYSEFRKMSLKRKTYLWRFSSKSLIIFVDTRTTWYSQSIFKFIMFFNL